jgi:tetratricopeptide (TPR) repeat protein
VRDGAIRYPGDFLLNIRLGDLYGDRDADDAAIRYLSAARAVRPGNAAVNALLGDRLTAVGDLPGAVAMFTEAVRLNPGYTNVYPIMGGNQMILGDHEGARRSFESILAAAPLDAEAQFGEFIARCAAGEFSSADLMEHWKSNQAVTDGRPWVTAWLLSFHADPGWRDPAGALEIIAFRRDVTNDSRGLVEAAALVQLDRPQEALVALERGEESGDLVAGQRALFAAIRARAYFILEDRERAEHYFDVCETIMEEIMYDGMEPWSRSAIVRWHRENAERLGR